MKKFVLPILVLGVFTLSDWAATDDLEIVHIDVGQGDSAFIAGPDGTTVLIDAGGGSCNTGHPRDNIYDVLNANGISVANRLDFIVLTHFHQDHTRLPRRRH